MVDFTPCSPNIEKLRRKRLPFGKNEGLGTPQTTAPPRTNPRVGLTTVPMTLPMVTAQSGEKRGCVRRAALRGSGPRPKSLQNRDGTGRPGTRQPAQSLRCVSEGTEVLRGALGDSGPQTPCLGGGGGSQGGRRPSPALAGSSRF